MRNLTAVLSKVSAVFLVVVMLFTVLLGAIQVFNHFTDKTIVPVTTNIMSPTIPGGSLVFASKTPENDLEVGDIITVQVTADNIMMGRLTDINSVGDGSYNIVFIGDNKALPEPFPYQVKNVTSTVLFHIPVLGYLVGGVASPFGAVMYVVLALIAAIIYGFKGHKWVWLPFNTRRIRIARKIAIQRMNDKEDYYNLEEVRELFQPHPEDMNAVSGKN